jgi:hypothetical protein
LIKVLIHACNQRLWYVHKYLVPSLKAQGIDDVQIFLDKDHLGCVFACMKCFSELTGDGHTWHLQDDVVIAENFKELAESYEWFNGIVCGIRTRYDEGRPDGDGTPMVDKGAMWSSFPCIRIPDTLAKSCAFSFEHSSYYDKWRKTNRGDDMIFRKFLRRSVPDAPYINAIPNLVDHIDYLLGWSTSEVKAKRKLPSRALHFDPSVAEKLSAKLCNFL